MCLIGLIAIFFKPMCRIEIENDNLKKQIMKSNLEKTSFVFFFLNIHKNILIIY